MTSRTSWTMTILLHEVIPFMTGCEAMIKFQGRSFLKQYMPMKPVKWGIKVWLLGDSSNEYFSKFTRANKRGWAWRAHSKNTKGLEKKSHNVFFNNFFTSMNLLEDLEDSIYGCSIVQRDRKGLWLEEEVLPLCPCMWG